MALRTSGRLSVSTATPSATSTRRSAMSVSAAVEDRNDFLADQADRIDDRLVGDAGVLTPHEYLRHAGVAVLPDHLADRVRRTAQQHVVVEEVVELLGLGSGADGAGGLGVPLVVRR